MYIIPSIQVGCWIHNSTAELDAPIAQHSQDSQAVAHRSAHVGSGSN